MENKKEEQLIWVDLKHKGTFHVFLLLGQSNMAGFSKVQATDLEKDSRILVLGFDNNQELGRVADIWDTACPPLHEAWAGAVGIGDWFGKTIIDRYPNGDKIGLIPCALSGQRIETFMKGENTKYDWIVNRAKKAQEDGGIIEGILFHQGESNNGEPTWPSNVALLIKDLKSDLNLGDIPLLVGELLYSGGCSGHNVLVKQVPTKVKNCHLISAEGLVVDPTDVEWNLHFSHDSEVELGKRYANKMIEVLGL